MSLEAPEAVLSQLLAAPHGGSSVVGEDRVVQQLRTRGYPVRDVGGRWVLASPWPCFDPRRFESLRRGELGNPLHVWHTATSTNDLAAQAGPEPPGAAWLAEAQTQGRGRHGRTWQASPGRAVLVSVRLELPREDPAPLGWLPLAIGLGITEGLREAFQVPVGVKWPNDVFLAGAKLGGILVEMRGGAPRQAVIGVGLNVLDDPEVAGAGGICLAAGVAEPEREAVLAAALAGLETRWRDWGRGDLAALKAGWERCDVLAGRAIRVQTAGRRLAARALGVASDGRLRARLRDGRETAWSAAEVHLR